MKTKIKKIFVCEQPWYKKWWIYVVFSFVLFVLLFVIPCGINEVYKAGLVAKNPYITMWGAGEALVFYGSFLAFVGTVSLGGLALVQNNKIQKNHEDNQKRDEAINQMPFLALTGSRFKIFDHNYQTLVSELALRNSNNGYKILDYSINTLIDAKEIYLYLTFKNIGDSIAVALECIDMNKNSNENTICFIDSINNEYTDYISKNNFAKTMIIINVDELNLLKLKNYELVYYNRLGHMYKQELKISINEKYGMLVKLNMKSIIEHKNQGGE
ncbi:MAG: hypothetical protein WBO70_04800 [Erysipelotrichaceae bacterium]